jgi:hypothetical protein
MRCKPRQQEQMHHTAWAHIVAMDRALRWRSGMVLCEFAVSREINRSTARRYLDFLIDRVGMPVVSERGERSGKVYKRVWRYAPRTVSLFSSWAHKWVL